jgi:hypothetical protein
MASLSEDLRLLAALEDQHGLKATPAAAEAGGVANVDLGKINWQRLACFTIPMANIFLAMYGMPPIPVPAFCNTPPPATA